jgi:hypothetical protein
MRYTFIIAITVFAAQAVAQPASPRWASAIDSMVRLEMAREKTVGAQIAIVERGRLVYTKGARLEMCIAHWVTRSLSRGCVGCTRTRIPASPWPGTWQSAPSAARITPYSTASCCARWG